MKVNRESNTYYERTKAMQSSGLIRFEKWVGVLLVVALHAHAVCLGAPFEPSLSEGERPFKFASVSEGQEVLSTTDEFVMQMSAFDRQVRLQSEADQGVTKLLNFSANQVLQWTSEEKEILTESISRLEPKLQELGMTWSEPIKIIKTTGQEESDAAYTRGMAIIFPQSKVGTLDRLPTRLLAHELFHVISRSKPELRDRLFKLIGFHRVPMIELPKHLDEMRITNPDAPKIEHIIQLNLDADVKVFATPFLFSKEAYTPTKKSLFGYLQFQLMKVVKTTNGNWMPAGEELSELFISPDHPDYWRQIGGNTRYVIHPEEIIADNFSLLITGEKPKDPLLIEAVKRELLHQQ